MFERTGTFYAENLRHAKATDVYVCKGASSPVARPVMAGTDPAATPDPAAHAAGHDAAGHSDQAGHENSDVETCEPNFTFHGFQFAELTVERTAHAPSSACHLIDDKLTHCICVEECYVINYATPPTGRFECSNAGVNRLGLNGAWSQRDNFLSVSTDCPQRNERFRWMGDGAKTSSHRSAELQPAQAHE